MGYLAHYLKSLNESEIDSNRTRIAFMAILDELTATHPEVADGIIGELKKQRNSLKLIASENYSSLTSQLTMGNWLTDKYAEGIPFHRYYAGCDHVDQIESKAANALKELFGADHAYVQPHSGADANLVAFMGILAKRYEAPELEKLGKKSVMSLNDEEYEKLRSKFGQQKIMGMDLSAGGHLTHGFQNNISGKLFRAVSYGVDSESHLIDYKKVEEIAMREKPLILIAGYSAYSRLIDFSIMKEIADKAGATLMVDMAHFSGLVAGKAITGNFDPIPFADVVTSTTHKTLRGPRGGLVLCKEEFKEVIDKGCPHALGGPLPHVMAAKLVAFKEAMQPEFRTWAKDVITNAQTLGESMMKRGAHVLTGGTDNHMIVVDVEKTFGITGRQAELALAEVGITLNRNTVPNDKMGAWFTSGIRLGTPALTTRKMGVKEMELIGELIYTHLESTKPAIDPKTGKPSKSKFEIDEGVKAKTVSRVKELFTSFPLYEEVCIDETCALQN